MDHMRISGTEPSSVILSQAKLKMLKSDAPKCQNKLKPNGMNIFIYSNIRLNGVKGRVCIFCNNCDTEYGTRGT